jgi:hypothetical protein
MLRTWLAAALTAGALSSAAAQGPIGTVPRGPYVCELPGDAAGFAGQPQPEAGFTIVSASRYAAPQGSGTYLRRGDTLVMTSGPRQGERYAIRTDGFMRRIENDAPGRLRCVLGND